MKKVQTVFNTGSLHGVLVNELIQVQVNSVGISGPYVLVHVKQMTGMLLVLPRTKPSH